MCSRAKWQGSWALDSGLAHGSSASDQTPADLLRGNQIRVRPVMLSILSVTHLRSRCPLHSSAFAAGGALVAAWDLQVVYGPAKLLSSSSWVSVSSLIPGPRGHREISRVASASLSVSCHRPGMLGWVLLSYWGGCLAHLCWDSTKMSPPFFSTL